jgi:hypothetical protein
MEALNSNNQFYQNNILPLLANINGNSLKSKMMSGQITQSMWAKCYNVYAFDMARVQDQVQDNLLKSFQIQFKCDTASATYTYDFYYIMVYENELSIDRISGQITA